MDRVYHIPKKLDRDFELLAHYTFSDTCVMICLFALGLCVGAFSGAYQLLYPLPVYAAFRFQHDGLTLFSWSRIALRFLTAQQLHTNQYILFERWRDPDGNDQPAGL